MIIASLGLTSFAAYKSYYAHLQFYSSGQNQLLRELDDHTRQQVMTDAKISAAVTAACGLAITIMIALLVRWHARIRSELEFGTYTDELTGLANRKLLRRRLAMAIERSRRNPDYQFAVLFLDFDRLKLINDSLGHDAGDELLRQIAKRLDSQVGRGEGKWHHSRRNLAARLGGDEFVVLLKTDKPATDAIATADRLLAALAAPYDLDGHETVSTASIGIVTSAGQYTNADDALRDADLAMYEAKAAGRARYVVFDKRMHDAVMYRLKLERELRKAFNRDQLSIELQPIVSLESGRIHGIEALMRWHHPELGVVPARKFIPIAEETDLIVSMGQWMIDRAMQKLSEMATRIAHAPDLSLHINMSYRELVHHDLGRCIRQAAAKYDFELSRLHLEVSESLMTQRLADMRSKLTELQSMGVKLVLDNLGTSHSLLGSLHQFPVQILKIDPLFIEHLGSSDINYTAVLQALVTLAHSLDMTIIADGVGTTAQLAQLQALDCDQAQGSLFASPMSKQAIESLLHERGGLFGRVIGQANSALPSI